MPIECSLLPHGGYTLLPAVLSTMAWLASLAQDGCDYARITGPVVNDLTQSNIIPYLEVGFNAYREPSYYPDEDKWKVEYTGHCYDYGDVVNIDGYWKVAKAFAFISLVFGGGGALFLWFSSCFVFSPGTWRWAGYEVFIASFFQGMAFLWFRTEMCQAEGNDCGLFFGSKTDIVAAVFWFVSAITIFLRYPTPTPKTGDTRNGAQAREVESAATTESNDVVVEELELPVEGSASATLPALDNDPGALKDGAVVPDADII